MPESAIRFGVKDQNGLRAATWKCWTNRGTGKFDVYLSCRELGGELKVSLHESGNWHIAFAYKLWAEGFEDPETKPETRFTDRWTGPHEFAPGYSLAFLIVVPWSSPDVAEGSEDPKIMWIPSADPGQAIEISVVFTKNGVSVQGWPGKSSMSTELVGALDLENGDRVWVVQRSIPFNQSQPGSGTVRFFKGFTPEDLTSINLRSIIFGTQENGVRVMIDTPIRMTPNEPT